MTTSTNRRFLVTGAAGFIGSHFVEHLVREGAHVRALVRYGSQPGYGPSPCFPGDVQAASEVVDGDVTDASCVDAAAAGCDVVLHLAALISIPYSYRALGRCLEVNAGGTLRVLEACRRNDVGRLVHASTSEVYGSVRLVPMPESHPLQLQSSYAATKLAADTLVESMR